MKKIKPRRIWEEPEVEYTIGTEEQFCEYMIEQLEKRGEEKPFTPSIYYNQDGDEFEIIWDTDMFFGERTGDFTVYRSQEDSSKIVGICFGNAKERMGLQEITKKENK